MSMLKFKPKSKNTQVERFMSDIQEHLIQGKYGNPTKCIIIMESSDEIGKSNISFETCGLHLTEAIGMVEITKSKLIGSE